VPQIVQEDHAAKLCGRILILNSAFPYPPDKFSEVELFVHQVNIDLGALIGGDAWGIHVVKINPEKQKIFDDELLKLGSLTEWSRVSNEYSTVSLIYCDSLDEHSFHDVIDRIHSVWLNGTFTTIGELGSRYIAVNETHVQKCLQLVELGNCASDFQ